MIVTGHRGAMAVVAENTMASFARAVADGADHVEFDVRCSRDGRLVVMHDERVDRTTDGSGAVRDLTGDQLRRLDAGAGERVPFAEEVISAVPVGLQIEIKAAEAVAPLAELLLGCPAGVRRRTVVTSFDERHITGYRALDPDLPVGYITGTSTMDFVRRASAIGADKAMLGLGTLTAEMVSLAHSEGREVHTWLVDTADALDAATRLGVDGFTTNDPGRLRLLLDRVS